MIEKSLYDITIIKDNRVCCLFDFNILLFIYKPFVNGYTHFADKIIYSIR